jgi:hypothetical protein
MTVQRFAIVNGIATAHRCVAVCEVWTYDVWGNARDGYEVNDRSCQDRSVRLECELTISNVPSHPGAKDDYRSFSDSGSFSAEACFSFSPSEKAIADLFGMKPSQCEFEGDDRHIQVNRKRDGRPIGEVIIDAWEPKESTIVE